MAELTQFASKFSKTATFRRLETAYYAKPTVTKTILYGKRLLVNLAVDEIKLRGNLIQKAHGMGSKKLT